MVLVSFKNFHIWTSHVKNGVYAHIWHMIFGNNSSIFGPIALEFVMGAQKTVID